MLRCLASHLENKKDAKVYSFIGMDYSFLDQFVGDFKV